MHASMPSHPIEVGLCANHVLFRRGRSGEKRENGKDITDETSTMIRKN